MSENTDGLSALSVRVRTELDMLAYPAAPWVKSRDHASGQRVHDVLIVGGGQSGLTVANGLMREGITNILCLDRSPAGYEGPWETFARMGTLRTPKFLVGTELGYPSLSIQSYYVARFGQEAWDAIDRVPRTHWMDYLRWYRQVLGLPVQNDTTVLSIGRVQDGVIAVEAEVKGKPECFYARRIVLATGYDGGGEWRIPTEISSAVAPERVFHSNGPVDFSRMRGKRVGVLGHGASSFDNAARALAEGAESVDLCFRRQKLPLINPHRWIEFVGFLKHFPDLSDRTRWQVNVHFKKIDQPPARWGFGEAHSYDRFAMHPGCPWLKLEQKPDGSIEVETPKGRMTFDYLICATGSALDFGLRPELALFRDEILPWRDMFTPPPEDAHPTLGFFPYLGSYYEFKARPGADEETLRRIFAFNFSAIVSMGPHSTSVSGHKYSVPRVLRGLTRSIMLEQERALMPDLTAYDESDLDFPQARAAAE
jgi:cation diffusion facilitator CzcD-associated flavoprotein CzcO